MAATMNPLQQWYAQDVMKFPPLASFAAYIFGVAASAVVPGFLPPGGVYDVEDAKAFMRATVLVMDLVVFFSSAWQFCRVYYSGEGKKKDEAGKFLLYKDKGLSLAQEGPIALVSEVFLLILLQPALVLVDHGYFQYNAIHLGLVVWSLCLGIEESPFSASVLLALSLNFNQVAYHFALPILLYLCLVEIGAAGDGNCGGRTCNVLRFYNTAKVALALVSTFGLLWTPFCLGMKTFSGCRDGIENVFSVVATLPADGNESPAIWSALPPFCFLRRFLTNRDMLIVSAVSTIIGLVPSLSDLIRHKKSPRRLVWAMFNCSLTFVLLSHRVDRFSILLPLMPAALLAGEVPGPSTWFSVVAAVSVAPILVEESLALAYSVVLSIFVAVATIIFRKELLFLPVPWQHEKEAGETRFGIKMLDVSSFLKLSAVVAGVVTALRIIFPGDDNNASASGVVFWKQLHYACICISLCFTWTYSHFYQLRLPGKRARAGN